MVKFPKNVPELDPELIHWRNYPWCPFGRGKATYNIPYCIELLSLALGPDQSGGNLPTAFDLNISFIEHPSLNDDLVNDARIAQSRFEYSGISIRLFSHNQESDQAKIVQLSEAGFFVRTSRFFCYWCGGRVQTDPWRAIEDPWKEHARQVPFMTNIYIYI